MEDPRKAAVPEVVVLRTPEAAHGVEVGEQRGLLRQQPRQTLVEAVGGEAGGERGGEAARQSEHLLLGPDHLLEAGHHRREVLTTGLLQLRAQVKLKYIRCMNIEPTSLAVLQIFNLYCAIVPS